MNKLTTLNAVSALVLGFSPGVMAADPGPYVKYTDCSSAQCIGRGESLNFSQLGGIIAAAIPPSKATPVYEVETAKPAVYEGERGEPPAYKGESGEPVYKVETGKPGTNARYESGKDANGR